MSERSHSRAPRKDASATHPDLRSEKIATAYQAAVDRWLASEGEYDLSLELSQVLGELKESPDWHAPVMRSFLERAYRTLWKQVIYRPGAFQNYLDLAMETDENPARWQPPYAGVAPDIQMALAIFAQRGNLHAIEEVSRITGFVLSKKEYEKAVEYSWENLFNPGLSQEPTYSGLKHTFEQEKASILDHGAAHIPSEHRASLAQTGLKKGLLRLLEQDNPGVAVLRRVVDICSTDGDGIKEFLQKKEMRDRLRSFWHHAYCSDPSNHEACLPLLRAIESLISSKGERWCPFQDAVILNSYMKNWDLAHLGRLEPFLDSLLSDPLFGNEARRGVRSEVLRIVVFGGQQSPPNPFFPEQLQAFVKWGLIDSEMMCQYLHKWAQQGAEQCGLAFDPSAAHGLIKAFGLEPLGVSVLEGHDPYRTTEDPETFERMANGEPEKYQRLADRLLIAYHSGHFSQDLQDLLREAVISREAKYQLLKNMLEYGLTSDTFDRFTVGDSEEDLDDLMGMDRRHDAQIARPRKIDLGFLRSFFEYIESLPFSKEQRESLIQLAHFSFAGATESFIDPAFDLPRLDVAHPVVVSIRLQQAKAALYESLSSFEALEERIDSLGLLDPGILPFDFWPRSEQERFILPLGSETERQAFLARRNTEATAEGEQMDRFSSWLQELGPQSYALEDERATTNGLITVWDKIPAWCAQSDSFREEYHRWIAIRMAARHEVRGMDFEKYPLGEMSEWSESALHAGIEMAIERGDWEMVTVFKDTRPFYRDSLESAEKEFAIVKMMQLRDQEIVFDDSRWIEQLISDRPELLEEIIAEDALLDEFYQECIAILYDKQSADYLIKRAPGLLPENIELQRAIARRVASAAFHDQGSSVFERNPEEYVPNSSWVEWEDERIREEVARQVTGFVESGFFSDESYLAAARSFESITGYSVTDPYFLVKKVEEIGNHPEGFSAAYFIVWFRQWEALGQKLERSFDTGKRKELLQLIVDELCISRITEGELLNFQTEYGCMPTELAIRRRALFQVIRYGAVGDAAVLAEKRGITLEFSAENLANIEPNSPRTEAILYASFLPKKGKERLEAERAFRKRSALAEFIPELLAIQSPAKRVEFCPYQQELTRLLAHETLFPIEDSQVRKGLLFFFRTFGIQDLPLLARAVVDLVTVSNGGEKPISTDQPALQELNQLLEIAPGVYSLEEYSAHLERAMQKMRESLLQDYPLDSRFERSALGMELFNAVVPHTGEYQAVGDRPKLIADTRVNAHKLVLDSLYAPASFDVEMAEEQELKGSLEESVTDRAIRLKQTTIEAKFQDEELQRFLQGWQRSLEGLLQESTGTSYAYWITPVIRGWLDEREARRTQLEGEAREKARASIEKKITALEESINRAVRLLQEKSSDQAPGKKAVTTLELLDDLQSLFKNAAGKVDRVKLNAEAGDAARSLCLAVMRDHSQEHVNAILEVSKDGISGGLSQAQIRAWEKWFREEYLEHFAGIRTDAQAALPANTRALLQKLWRTDGIEGAIRARSEGASTAATGNPLVDVFGSIQKTEAEITLLEKEGVVPEKQRMTFWPVKGLGRALSGDIANACFHRYREALARGDYPKLAALLMTLPGRTELAGSTLLIEAETVSGARVVVIRALNPTESVARELNAFSLVTATIEYVKELAEESEDQQDIPFEEIRLCVDQRGGHSTNRQPVADAEHLYVHMYGCRHGEVLRSTPETEFNGYDIAQASQTYVVWKRRS